MIFGIEYFGFSYESGIINVVDTILFEKIYRYIGHQFVDDLSPVLLEGKYI